MNFLISGQNILKWFLLLVLIKIKSLVGHIFLSLHKKYLKLFSNGVIYPIGWFPLLKWLSISENIINGNCLGINLKFELILCKLILYININHFFITNYVILVWIKI